ncbi:LysR family transcriptional regulator [Bosea vestrisii]|uniref:helix-turn-helix domain-containing protein n=1 Tax=Bosea vestrisii TaxID=151416 RepID=UPI0024DF5076|nr:LysR family transcriptional regulator [Bosea vestrisii]WID94969.1 LysR family transcriptional regulator [Bosea vestrisii]
MKLDHFEEVVAIAERGSMRAAARHLQIAQPALTRSLALLERELGAPCSNAAPAAWSRRRWARLS